MTSNESTKNTKQKGSDETNNQNNSDQQTTGQTPPTQKQNSNQPTSQGMAVQQQNFQQIVGPVPAPQFQGQPVPQQYQQQYVGQHIPPAYSQQMIYQPYQPPPQPGVVEQMITAVKYPMGMGNYKDQMYYKGKLFQSQPVYQTLPDGTVVVQEAFDPHTRFDMAKANIPPPPPGVAPNAAQMAQMKGKKVMLGKKNDSWIYNPDDGGYTFW